MTTQFLLNEWLENYKKEEIKARTYSRYQGLITTHIVSILGEKNITDLGRREIQFFLHNKKMSVICETAKNFLPQSLI